MNNFTRSLVILIRNYNDPLDLAETLARVYHENQVDKAGQPYIEHVRRVSEGCNSYTGKVVGWLHDIIEDTHIEEELLRHLFPDSVTDVVILLSKNRDLPETFSSSTRDRMYYSRIAAHKIATEVKLSDLKDNSDISRIDDPTVKDYKRTARYFQKIAYLMKYGTHV